ncbi:hypothetical protein XENTR_v10021452 [Xenopus tropicalis]|nr:hypothetical protein XENTR_v10021452 [Xenopus tropicalis]
MSAEHKDERTMGVKTDTQQYLPKIQSQENPETCMNSKTESLFISSKCHQNLNCNIKSPSFLIKHSDLPQNDAQCGCRKIAWQMPFKQESADEDNILKQRGLYSVQNYQKQFQADTTCNMRSQCKHHPGKPPSNVISWLFTLQDTQTEPVWITTLKLASCLVTGIKLWLEGSQGK